ncbi:MAG: aldo/keto reductase [Acidobacteriota bacterium]|jgi:predicted aldo/keto reductase-like oxidoreductase
MERIKLGKTGIEAVRFGFGGIPIQRVGERDAVEAVLYALQKGMDFIDTSRMYTTSESRIGRALKETDKRVTVATKSFSRTADAILKDIETSLNQLQLDYIDLYQCHAVSNEEEYRQVTGPDGALAGLQRAKDEGLIGHVGITSHSLDLLEKAVDDGLFETIMVCYSFLEPAAAEKVIPKARQKQIGILAMKPLSGGVIESPVAALKWVFACPDLLVLAGVEKKEYIDQNWEAFVGGAAISEEEARVIKKIQAEFDHKFCRRCDYCLPCPAGIHIQFAMGVRSMVRRMGAQILQQPMFKDIWDKALDCTECGDCMQRCPYDLPIPDMIKENLDWVNSMRNRKS